MESEEPSPTQRELADLRQRADGPTPDITGDPTALARLDELQNRHLRRSSRHERW